MVLMLGKMIARLCEIAVVFFLTLIIADILIGIFFRYVIGNALSWSEELARYLMIWMGFTAAILVLREEGHIGINILRDSLPQIFRRFLILAVDLLIIIFLAIWCWNSLQTLQVIKDDISSGLRIRLLWPFLAMPVCSGLMILQQLTLIPMHIKMLGSHENVTLEDKKGE